MYLSLVWAALCNLLYFALHVTCSGTFPKPLTPRQERECLERIRHGDPGAKNMLIEHNLRLVAHIVKKCYHKRRVGKQMARFQSFTDFSFVAHTKGKM